MADLSLLRTPAGMALTLGIWAGYAGSVLYLYVALRRIPSDLMQLMVFRRLDLLRRGVLLMSGGLVVGSLAILLLIEDPAMDLAPLAVVFFAGLAVFVYGLLCCARVIRPRSDGAAVRT